MNASDLVCDGNYPSLEESLELFNPEDVSNVNPGDDAHGPIYNYEWVDEVMQALNVSPDISNAFHVSAPRSLDFASEINFRMNFTGNCCQHKQPGLGTVCQLVGTQSALQDQVGVSAVATDAPSADVGQLLTHERERRERHQRTDRRQGRRSELVDDNRPVRISASVHGRTAAVHLSASGEISKAVNGQSSLTTFHFIATTVTLANRSANCPESVIAARNQLPGSRTANNLHDFFNSRTRTDTKVAS